MRHKIRLYFFEGEFKLLRKSLKRCLNQSLRGYLTSKLKLTDVKHTYTTNGMYKNSHNNKLHKISLAGTVLLSSTAIRY